MPDAVIQAGMCTESYNQIESAFPMASNDLLKAEKGLIVRVLGPLLGLLPKRFEVRGTFYGSVCIGETCSKRSTRQHARLKLMSYDDVFLPWPSVTGWFNVG